MYDWPVLLVSALLFFQRSFFCRLTEDKKSEKFFRVFYDRMKLAQLEIKATVTVNTSDLGNRKKDDDAQDKDLPVRKKGQQSTLNLFVLYAYGHVTYGL